jgi:Homeodomain
LGERINVLEKERGMIRDEGSSDGNETVGTGNRPRRGRLSQRKTGLLDSIFRRTPRPSSVLRSEIACSFGMTERSVQIWFQNRRAKESRSRRMGKTETALMEKAGKFLRENEGNSWGEKTSLCPSLLENGVSSYEDYLGIFCASPSRSSPLPDLLSPGPLALDRERERRNRFPWMSK